MKTRPERFTDLLPATPCTKEIRERISIISDDNLISMAQVQRTAVLFFLEAFDKNPDAFGLKIKQGAKQES